MEKYVVLLRGINVGGRNKVKMAELRDRLSEEGFQKVKTYIQSGNITLQSSLSSEAISRQLKALLEKHFTLDTPSIKILTISKTAYQSVIKEAPDHYGEAINKIDYRYDVLFLIAISSEDAIKEIATRTGIDQSWEGTQVIYYRRPGPTHPDYTKSALSRLAKKDIYQSITVRNWKTVTKLWEMLNDD